MGYTSGYNQGNINLADSGSGGGVGEYGVRLITANSETRYPTITAALAAAAAEDTVKVGPGTYNAASGEVFPLVIPNGVNLESDFEAEATIEGHIVMNQSTRLVGFNITPQAGQTPGINMSGNFAFVTNTRIVGSDATANAVECAGVGVIRGRFLLGGTWDNGIVANGSSLAVREMSLLASANIADAVVRLNSGTMSHDGLLAINAASTFAYGFRVAGGATLFSYNARLFNATITGACLYITGDGAIVDMTAPQFDVDALNILADPAVTTGALTIASGRCSRDGIEGSLAYLGQDTVILGFLDEKVGDEGFIFAGELVQGTPFSGQGSAFGQGSSYTNEMVVLRENAGGGVFTDITSDLLLPDGTTAALFDTGALNERLYIGGPFPQESVNVNLDTGATYGVSTFLLTEVSDGGGGWVSLRTMSAAAEAPYERYGNDIMARSGDENLRFQSSAGPQLPQLVNGNDLYWYRITITGSPLGVVPVASQVRLGPNRFEASGGGAIEYYGEAIKPLTVNVRRFELQGAAPANAQFVVQTGPPLLRINVPDSRFNNGVRDGFGGIVRLPVNLDSSRDLLYVFEFKPNDNTSGNVDFILRYALVAAGSVFDGTSITVVSDSFSVPTPLNTQDTLISVSRVISIPLAVEAEDLFFSLERDGAADTYNGTIDIAPDDEVRCSVYF